MQKTVLVADDHAVLADALAKALREWYHVPAPVTSLRLLSHAVAIAKPDAVLLDLSFGTECALALFPALQHQSPATKFIIFTNHEEEAFAIASARAGAHGFLTKTVDMDAVRSAIDAACAGEPTAAHSPITALRATRPPSPSQELVRWLLGSAYSHTAIAALVGISVKGVEYHAARLRGEQPPPKSSPLGKSQES